MTSEEKIHQAATDNGWTLFKKERFYPEWRKKSRYLCVAFSVRGSVVSASSGNRQILGTNKLDSILEILEKKTKGDQK